ncbi:MAG: hypothetical protein IT385_02335 [Deltaproteobacteria bacterium]|nr:hypothetical protein [Deltaproteobacteria bacterium]
MGGLPFEQAMQAAGFLDDVHAALPTAWRDCFEEEAGREGSLVKSLTSIAVARR